MTKVKKLKSTTETNGLPRNGRGSPPFESSQRPQPTDQPTEETIQLLTLTEEQFRAVLTNLSRGAGSMAELARQLNVSGQWIGDICAGRKKPGAKLLAALGATSEVIYKIPISRGEEE